MSPLIAPAVHPAPLPARRAAAVLQGMRLKGLRLAVLHLPVLHLAMVLLTVLALAGCLQSRADFHFGVSTAEVVGTVDVDGDEAALTESLILVYKYHYKFAQLDPDPVVTHPTASIVQARPDGTFSFSVPTDVVDVEVLFMSPDRLTDVFRFHKQVGIGQVIYRARLPPMRGWRSHFYTSLAPELQHVIVESRYQLGARDQALLADWLRAQQRRLEAPRTESQG